MKSKASDQTGKQKPAATSKLSPKRKSKQASATKASKEANPLAMCPIDGAGWCPYPFSVAQLKKRLKARAAALS